FPTLTCPVPFLTKQASFDCRLLDLSNTQLLRPLERLSSLQFLACVQIFKEQIDLSTNSQSS
ncbi:hypothetical protein, partial [Testudinibacter sp. TR-2022]|uniref:hypothetical protein n=1 Tax=Testudinibacter sp. TR-2022 TaxID=2585029 RepID=UPI002278BB8D